MVQVSKGPKASQGCLALVSSLVKHRQTFVLYSYRHRLPGPQEHVKWWLTKPLKVAKSAIVVMKYFGGPGLCFLLVVSGNRGSQRWYLEPFMLASLPVQGPFTPQYRDPAVTSEGPECQCDESQSSDSISRQELWLCQGEPTPDHCSQVLVVHACRSSEATESVPQQPFKTWTSLASNACVTSWPLPTVVYRCIPGRSTRLFHIYIYI